MTERLKGVCVTFEDEIREDDAGALISAIGRFRGVLSVDPVPTNPSDYIVETRTRRRLVAQILDVLGAS